MGKALLNRYEIDLSKPLIKSNSLIKGGECYCDYENH